MENPSIHSAIDDSECIDLLPHDELCRVDTSKSLRQLRRRRECEGGSFHPNLSLHSFDSPFPDDSRVPWSCFDPHSRWPTTRI
jgi:hypothetical protein